jgi:hypothetical protein
MRHYKTGDRILLKTRVGRKTKEVIGVFQGMQSKSRAVVFVDPDKADDDGMRLVDLKSLQPYYNDPTDQQRRARHAMRMFKQGIRWFRLDKPTGVSFNVMQIDIVNGTAFGCKRKRKTIQQVPLHDLWPETFK